ncbi:MAG: hypothetical protein VB858_17630, partial [Planctomycetaceae bacterium]
MKIQLVNSRQGDYNDTAGPCTAGKRVSISNFTIIRKRQSTLLLLCSLTTLAVLCFDLLMPLGVAGGVPYVLVVLLSMRFTHSDTPIFVALVCTTLTLLG